MRCRPLVLTPPNHGQRTVNLLLSALARCLLKRSRRNGSSMKSHNLWLDCLKHSLGRSKKSQNLHIKFDQSCEPTSFANSRLRLIQFEINNYLWGKKAEGERMARIVLGDELILEPKKSLDESKMKLFSKTIIASNLWNYISALQVTMARRWNRVSTPASTSYHYRKIFSLPRSSSRRKTNGVRSPM